MVSVPRVRSESASFTEQWSLLAHAFPPPGEQLDLEAVRALHSPPPPPLSNTAEEPAECCVVPGGQVTRAVDGLAACM